jgi:hypothetical protein
MYSDCTVFSVMTESQTSTMVLSKIQRELLEIPPVYEEQLSII